MPLSDHEQKMLQQMEQALAAEDPKFASQMQGSTLASLQRRRWIVGVVGVVVGLGLVLVGVNTTMWIGAIGFAIMVAAAVFDELAVRALQAPAAEIRLATSDKAENWDWISANADT